MEKKDLVIGKKYLHKGNREVYYLGESKIGDSKIGDSIVQPTNGINGIVSLKACHPELKDIIGNDRFWGYFNIHLELSEIEPKYLTVNELVGGEIYFGKHRKLDVIFIPNKCEIYDNRNFCKVNSTDEIKEITESNQEQKDWLNNCIKANKFVPKDYIEEIPEYVECISELDGTEVGKIYKVINDREVLCDKGRIYYFRERQFKPSTKDAFKAQNKVKENTFEVSRWYRYSANYIKESTYAKYSSNQSVTGRFYYDEIITEKNGYKKGHNWSVLTCMPTLLTDLSEIQQYLPDNHVDKIKKNPIKKWSVGSYVVPLQDKLLTRSEPLIKGKPYQIIRYGCIPYIICEKGTEINFNEYPDGEKSEGIKWFATLEEAQEFSDTLKNKKTMNYKFKVGDRVKVVKTGYGTSDTHEPFVTITSLGTYMEEPGYSVEPKIGNCLSGAYNGMIREESFELYKEEEWAPQVGEYAVMVKAGGFGYHPVNNGCIAKITKVCKDINSLYVISGEILNPNKKTNNYFQSVPIWRKDYGVICRKALPHEIPSQVMKAKEFNFEEFLYEEPAFNPFIKQYPLTPKEAFKPNGLDLSLRDEKEMNVNEIKTSNNNISKLNLSLNN